MGLKPAQRGGANLCGSNLSGANLIGANLSGAKLEGASLTGASLCRAKLGRSDFSDATLLEVIGLDTCIYDNDEPCVINDKTIECSGPLPDEFLRACLTEPWHHSLLDSSGSSDEVVVTFRRSVWGQLFPVEQALAQMVGSEYIIEKSDERIVVKLDSPDRFQDALDALLPVLAGLESASPGEISDLSVNQANGEREVLDGQKLKRTLDHLVRRFDEEFPKRSTPEEFGLEGLKSIPIIGGVLSIIAAKSLTTSRSPAPDASGRQALRTKTFNVFRRFFNGARGLRRLFSDSKEPPADLVKVIGAITTELIEYLSSHPNEMNNIRPRQFEELIAEILASYGWDVQLTPETRDGGYDIFAISKDTAGVQTSWIIECKKYAPHRKVGVDFARSLFGVKGDLNVGMAMLATTSHFTKGVNEYKASRYDLELKDYEGILEWVNEYRPNPNGRLYLKDNRLVLPGDEE